MSVHDSSAASTSLQVESTRKRKGDAVQREIDVNATAAHIEALASHVELLRDMANAAEAAFQRGDVGAEIAMYKAKLELSEQCAALDKAKRKAELEHRVALETAWQLALADLAVLQQRIAVVTLNSVAEVTANVTPLTNADFAATLDEFLTRANVAPLSHDVVAAMDGAMDSWWAHARDFVPAGGSKTFGQLLLDNAKNVNQSELTEELTEVTPLFASLMFELMRVLSMHNPSLFLFAEASLVGTVADDDSGRPSACPSWFVRERDDTDLYTHRKVDIALFTHDATTRDATAKFNLCAQRNVCTAVEIKRDISEHATRKALKQLTEDYSMTVAAQFVGERRVMFGIVGTAAQLRICQLWSNESHFVALASPILSIATVSELGELLGDPTKKWSNVVRSNPTFLQTIARVVLHSASAPGIDCGLKLPRGTFSASIGGYERVRFERVLGVSRRSIVVNAVLSRSDGSHVKSVAFKRYGIASDAARDREVTAYETFGGAGDGVVSCVGRIVNARGAVEAVATEPVGVALSQMCLCGSSVRCAVAAALRGGPLRALASIHAASDVFPDIHDGNIIVVTNEDGGTEARSQSTVRRKTMTASTKSLSALNIKSQFIVYWARDLKCFTVVAIFHH
jgi:hypothetical protein